LKLQISKPLIKSFASICLYFFNLKGRNFWTKQDLIKWGVAGGEVYKSSALKYRAGGLIDYNFLDKTEFVLRKLKEKGF